MKRNLLPVEGERVRLRLLQEADLPLTLAWRNRDEIRCCFIHSEVISPEQHKAWYDSYCLRDDDFVFIIEDRQTPRRPVGQISLYHVDWHAGRAEFGRLMIGDPAARRSGLAREATRLILEMAFNQFDLTEVYLEVFEHNVPAVSLYRSCGFQLCGQHDNLLAMNLVRPGR